MHIISSSANKPFRYLERQTAVFRQPVNQLHICRHDLVTYAIARQHHYFAVRRHNYISPVLTTMVVLVCGLPRNRLSSRFFPWSSQYHPALRAVIFSERHPPRKRWLHRLAAESSVQPDQSTVLGFQYLPHPPATHHVRPAKRQSAKFRF